MLREACSLRQLAVLILLLVLYLTRSFEVDINPGLEEENEVKIAATSDQQQSPSSNTNYLASIPIQINGKDGSEYFLKFTFHLNDRVPDTIVTNFCELHYIRHVYCSLLWKEVQRRMREFRENPNNGNAYIVPNAHLERNHLTINAEIANMMDGKCLEEGQIVDAECTYDAGVVERHNQKRASLFEGYSDQEMLSWHRVGFLHSCSLPQTPSSSSSSSSFAVLSDMLDQLEVTGLLSNVDKFWVRNSQ